MRRAGEFEELRPLLFSIAYRILGSVSEAEDAVQETWLRYAASPAQPASARAFLSAVATRISINVLRSARYRREEYVGPWLPGPLIEDPYQDPQRSAELADSVSMAALLLLERLSPPFWKAPGPELLEPALHTAAGLEDPGIALMLLRPFAVEWVTPAHAGGLAALAARYGESWHRNLLDAWFGSRNTWRYTGDVDRKGWAGALPGLTAALRDAGAAATAGWLLAASWAG